jgi:hypothetical protein
MIRRLKLLLCGAALLAATLVPGLTPDASAHSGWYYTCEVNGIIYIVRFTPDRYFGATHTHNVWMSPIGTCG